MATTRNIQMQYYNGTDYDTLYPQVNLSNVSGNLNATNVSYSNLSTSSIITGNNVQLAIDQLFQSVSNGKTQIASAITDKGVSTSSSASFSTMASNIRKISTGYNCVLKGFAGYNDTVTYTASMIDGNSYDWNVYISLGNKAKGKTLKGIFLIVQYYSKNDGSFEGSSYTYDLCNSIPSSCYFYPVRSDSRGSLLSSITWNSSLGRLEMHSNDHATMTHSMFTYQVDTCCAVLS